MPRPCLTGQVIPCLTIALCACGADPSAVTVIRGDTEIVTTFEDGWDGWRPQTTTTGSDSDPQYRIRTDLTGGAGSCAWLESSNYGDDVQQIVVRRFRVDVRGPLTVRVRFMAGPSKLAESFVWAIGSVTTAPPSRSDLADLGPLYLPPSEPRRFLPFEISTLVPAHSQYVWIAVGYASGFEVRQGVCFDDIAVVIQAADSSYHQALEDPT